MERERVVVLASSFLVDRAPWYRQRLGDRYVVRALSDADEAAVIEAVREAEVVVTHRWKPEMSRVATRLRLLHAPGAGLDKLDLGSLPASVAVANAFGHERAIAEWVLMAALALRRRSFDGDRQLRAGVWELCPAVAPPVIHELGGATLGVIGLGHIGRSVTRLAHALDLRVVAVNRSPVDGLEDGSAPDSLLGWDGLPELLGGSDFVVLAVGLNDETRGLIGAPELALMGAEACLINPARGGLADEEALYIALRDGVIAGAALDAWWDEPRELTVAPPSRFGFAALPNVILSPHNSGGTVESFMRNHETVAGNIERLYSGEPLRNPVRH